MNRMWVSQQSSGGQYPPLTALAGGDAAACHYVDYPPCHPTYSSSAQRFGPTTARRPALQIHGSQMASQYPNDPSSNFQVFDAVSPPRYFQHQQSMRGQIGGAKDNHYPEVLFYERLMVNSNPASTMQKCRPEGEISVPSRVQAQCASPFANRPITTALDGFKKMEYIRQESPDGELQKRHVWTSPARDSSRACPDMAVDAQLLLEAANQAAKEVRSITPVSSPTSALGKPSIQVSPPRTFCEIIDSSELVSMELYGSVSDALLVSMSQMKICRLTEEDRFGNYKHRQLGFVGICCKFCGGLPGFGRHFPGSFQSLLSGSHCVRIVKHMRSECRSCPPSIRGLIKNIENESREPSFIPNHQSQIDHGSRKRFVAHVWAKLQQASAEKYLAPTETESDLSVVTNATSSQGMDCRKPIIHGSNLTWDALIRKSQLVEEKDLHLVPDATFFALAQMNEWPLTAEDKIGRHKDQQLGFVGLCCQFCNGKTGKPRYGRYFPSCLKTLAKPASCDRIANHIAIECPKCPEPIRMIMRSLQHSELSSDVRYGSRNIFFQRLWNRLHENDETIASSSCSAAAKSADDVLDTLSNGDTTDYVEPNSTMENQWGNILKGSTLVNMKDRGLVPDGQLAAMAQLEPCRLTAQDRVGWYKGRPIGFPGLACRHCKGRPGIGRYFPNTLRTFSQNNYCQIVGNHLKKDCSNCPEELRVTLVKLLSKNAVAAHNKLYAKGSRKALYDRIWSTVHHQHGSNTSSRSISISSGSEQGEEALGISCKREREDIVGAESIVIGEYLGGTKKFRVESF